MIAWTLLLLASAEGKYAKPELLIEPAEVVKAAEKYRVLDVRSAKAFAAGHVPGAGRVDVAAWTKAFAAKQDRDEWVTRLGALGLEVEKPVVVYGPAKAVDAFRAWWVLRYWGLKDVRVVNGGWEALVKAGVKPDRGEAKAVRKTRPDLKAAPERLATKEQILEGLKAGKFDALLDARSPEEHCGDKALAKRGGSMPGAKHLNWTATLDREGRVRPAAELAKLFQDAGIDLDRPATTYCQSGGRAAELAFVYELMTGRPARNYYRSWAEWGNDEKTPIVKPPKK